MKPRRRSPGHGGVPFGECLFSEVTVMRCCAFSTTAVKAVVPTACGCKPKNHLFFQGGTSFQVFIALRDHGLKYFVSIKYCIPTYCHHCVTTDAIPFPFPREPMVFRINKHWVLVLVVRTISQRELCLEGIEILPDKNRLSTAESWTSTWESWTRRRRWQQLVFQNALLQASQSCFGTRECLMDLKLGWGL